MCGCCPRALPSELWGHLSIAVSLFSITGPPGMLSPIMVPLGTLFSIMVPSSPLWSLSPIVAPSSPFSSLLRHGSMSRFLVLHHGPFLSITILPGPPFSVTIHPLFTVVPFTPSHSFLGCHCPSGSHLLHRGPSWATILRDHPIFSSWSPSLHCAPSWAAVVHRGPSWATILCDHLLFSTIAPFTPSQSPPVTRLPVVVPPFPAAVPLSPHTVPPVAGTTTWPSCLRW